MERSFLWAALVSAMLGTGCVVQPADPKDEQNAAQQEIFGHRFHVAADVNGDGVVDTLTECYYSKRLGREAAKYVEGWGYDSLVKRSFELNPAILLRCSNGEVDTLDERLSGFGLALLMNEGDLNGDGTDEIGMVHDLADWSNLNTYIVRTHTDTGWATLFRFDIWEWQLPDLPDAEREFGLIGQMGRKVHAPTDTVPAVDLVIPVRPGLVKVVGNIGEATLDTMEIAFPTKANTRG